MRHFPESAAASSGAAVDLWSSAPHGRDMFTTRDDRVVEDRPHARSELRRPERKVPMNDAHLVGGTEADRRRLLQRLDEYLDANGRFDWEKLQDIWSGAPGALFFNLNGHTYRGREHWTRLWQYYRDNVRSGYWTPMVALKNRYDPTNFFRLNPNIEPTV